MNVRQLVIGHDQVNITLVQRRKEGFPVRGDGDVACNSFGGKDFADKFGVPAVILKMQYSQQAGGFR